MKALGRRRIAAAWVIAAVVIVAVALPGAGSASAATPQACVDGFRRVAPTALIMPEDVYTASALKSFVAGGQPLSGGRRAARITTFGSGGWRPQTTMRLGSDSGFVALGGTVSSGLWAVGYIQTRTTLAPLAARRRVNGSWRRVAVPKPAGVGATLTDISSYQYRSAWAVGYRLGKPGVRAPYALRWANGRWAANNPRLRSGERGALTSVSTTKQGGTWVAGSTSRYGATRPYLAKRANGKWVRTALPAVGEGVLSALSVDSGSEGWAAGHHFEGGKMVPLLLSWDGSAWQRSTPPHLEGDSVLVDVSVDDAGTLSVAGSTWDIGDNRMKGFIATRQDAKWSIHVYQGTSRHSVATGVSGDPASGGWAVGRDLKSGVALRTCPNVTAASANTKQRLRRQRRAATNAARADISEASVFPEVAEPEPRKDLDRVPRLQIAAAGNVTIRDRAKAVGLPTWTTTHGAVIRDFNGDGRADIFLNGHSRPAALYFDRGAKFQRSPRNFGWGDRHDCAAADVDKSGLPDLYCSFGGGRGLGVKGNQLWLDPGAPRQALAPRAGGAPEPLGRGRAVVFLDVDKDGRKDLVLGQQQNRLDALPSTNRVYLADADASFRPMGRSGIATGIGVTSFDTGDIDRDGRTDLLMVFSDPQATGGSSGIRLYRNTPSGFQGVATRYGIRSIGERDAELVRLNGDRLPDLVQLSGNRIRVSLQSGGRFRSVFERKISNAVAVAAGDADGDGDMDLYVLRQKSRASIKDIILFNRGTGRSFRAVSAPSRSGGKADDVFAIDHDKNGLTDFLVLNGGSSKGPVQLISFYR